MRKADIPESYDLRSRFYAQAGEWINVGDSAIVAPGGELLAGPVRKKEEILYAEVDPAKIDESRYLFDVAGHYCRPDVFALTVNQEQRPIMSANGASALSGSAGGRKTKRQRATSQ
jgi:nitrilase